MICITTSYTNLFPIQKRGGALITANMVFCISNQQIRDVRSLGIGIQYDHNKLPKMYGIPTDSFWSYKIRTRNSANDLLSIYNIDKLYLCNHNLSGYFGM